MCWEAAASQLLLEALVIHARYVGGVQVRFVVVRRRSKRLTPPNSGFCDSQLLPHIAERSNKWVPFASPPLLSLDSFYRSCWYPHSVVVFGVYHSLRPQPTQQNGSGYIAACFLTGSAPCLAVTAVHNPLENSSSSVLRGLLHRPWQLASMTLLENVVGVQFQRVDATTASIGERRRERELSPVEPRGHGGGLGRDLVPGCHLPC